MIFYKVFGFRKRFPFREVDFSSPEAADEGLFAEMEWNEGKRRGKSFPHKGTNKGPIPAKKFAGKPAVGAAKPGNDKGWDGVAGWYDKLVGADGSDYHQNVILPGVMELLDILKAIPWSMSAAGKEFW